MNSELSFFEKNIYRIIFSVLLTVAFLFCAGSCVGIKCLSAWHFGVAFFIIVQISIFFTSSGKGHLISGLFMGILITCIIIAAGKDTAVNFVVSYYKWILGKEGWQSAWILGYELINTIFVSCSCCLLEMLLERYKNLQIGFACLIIIVLLISMLLKVQVPHTGVACVLLYLVCVFVEWGQWNWKKHKNRNFRVHTLWIMPFLVAFWVAMLFMPAPEKPYDWKFVKEAYHQVQKSISKINDFVWSLRGNDIGIAMSGFSEDARIFGGVSSGKVREIMKIHSQIDLKTNIYLSGKTFDTFDGTQWFHTGEEPSVIKVGESDVFTESKLYADTAKTVQSLTENAVLPMKNYLSKTTLRITYPKVSGKLLFLPVKTEYLKEKEENYVAVYYQMNLDTEQFYELLACTYEQNLEEASEQEIYLQEIILSEDVENYLEEITSGAKNDIEKIRLIEKELASFTYNRTPGPLPEYVVDESSFLDYFLLESKEGFCTHFATAFVLLARAEGFPTRYVQGFCVPIGDGRELTVSSDMAHAWPEVYINGVGFIPFEPTPGYSEIRYTPWKIQPNDTSGVWTGLPQEIEIQEKVSEPENMVSDLTDETGVVLPKFWKKIAYVLLILIVFAIFIWIADKMWERFRYCRMLYSEKFKVHADINFRLWRLLEVVKNENETLEEFICKIENRADYEEEMRQFIQVLEEVLYGGEEVTDDMLSMAQKVNEQLLVTVKCNSRLLYLFSIMRLWPYIVKI